MLSYVGWTGNAWYKLCSETHAGNVDEARKTLIAVYEMHRQHQEGPDNAG